MGESRGESFTKAVCIDQEKDQVRSSVGTQTHPTGMGVTVLQWMRWVRHYGKPLSRHILTKLSVHKCRSILTAHRSSHMMVRKTLLNMSAITSKWCRFILRIMHLCARCFLLASGLWLWGGLMGWGKGQSTALGSWFKSSGLDSLLYRVPQPIDALLSIRMGARETPWNYVNRYWELYNEIGGGNEKVAASTFRLGLSQDSEARDSLTMRLPESMH